MIPFCIVLLCNVIMNKMLESFKKWLDENYTPAEYGDYRSKYDGAVDMLCKAGIFVYVTADCKHELSIKE